MKIIWIIIILFITNTCVRQGYTSGYQGKSSTLISSDAKQYLGIDKIEYLSNLFSKRST